MRKFLNGSSRAVIVLHEIYGINQYIHDLCSYYVSQGFDVYCPCLIHRKYFSYSNVDTAYDHFMKVAGFDIWKDIDSLAKSLRTKYDKVYIHGSSVGATIAWKCGVSGNADGIICCYGSRIRDYLDIEMKCRVLLIFAHEDSFDVDSIAAVLMDKRNTQVHVLDGHHGFMDRHGEYFCEGSSSKALQLIDSFIN